MLCHGVSVPPQSKMTVLTAMSRILRITPGNPAAHQQAAAEPAHLAGCLAYGSAHASGYPRRPACPDRRDWVPAGAEARAFLDKVDHLNGLWVLCSLEMERR